MKQLFENILHPDLTGGKIFRTILFFALPVMISYLFQQLYNTADTIIVGHYLKETSLAAIGGSASVFELLIGFGNGFGNGLGIAAARFYGSGQQEKLKKVVASSLIITLFVSIFIMVCGGLFLRPLLFALKTPSEIFEECYSYIIIILLSCGVLFAYNLLSALLRSIGNSLVPLMFLIFSSVLNIILDIIFISRTAMGLRGAAVATVIAQSVSALLCLFYIWKKTKILVPELKSFIPEKRIYTELLSQGLSMAFMGSIVFSGTVILQSAVNGFGKFIMAGQLCARKIFALTNIPLICLGIANSTFTGQNFGAGRLDRVKKGIVCSGIISTAWSLLCLVLFKLYVPFLVRFISGTDNMQIILYAQKYLFFMTPFYVVLGWLFVFRNALQGLGYKVIPLISSVLELLGKILFTVLIIPLTGQWGIILCEPLIWVVMTVQLLYSILKALKECSDKNSPQIIIN